MKVQLLFFPGCPNAQTTRDALTRAFEQIGIPPRFEDLDVSAPGTPGSLKGWGSPTILVNGHDVSGGEISPRPSCRLYESSSSDNRGVPPGDAIVAALLQARKSRGYRLQHLAALPAAALALLPAATCPACLGGYLGVLSAIGLGFLVDERVLSPLILLALAIGIAGIARSMGRHSRPGPLALTILGSAAVIAGRLIWNIPVVLYGGITLILGASFWNLFIKRSGTKQLFPLPLEQKGVSS